MLLSIPFLLSTPKQNLIQSAVWFMLVATKRQKTDNKKDQGPCKLNKDSICGFKRDHFEQSVS